MKTYTIGRDPACKFSYTDEKISRQHAILKVYASGKMEIVDNSSNGTYINNVRIASNVPVPVTRKDNVSFAGARQFDWQLVPNPMHKYIKIAAGILIMLIVICGIKMCLNIANSNDNLVEDTRETMKSTGGRNIKDNNKNNVGPSGEKNDSVSGSKANNPDWVTKEIQKANKAKKKDKDKSKNSKDSITSSTNSKKKKDTVNNPGNENTDNTKNKEIF